MGTSGGICSERANGVVSAGSKYLSHETGALIVHSLAHVLGISHDDAACACPDPQGCIMNSAIGCLSSLPPLPYSSC